MSERDEWNRRIIEEFRANAGVVGGPFEGVPIFLTDRRIPVVVLEPIADVGLRV